MKVNIHLLSVSKREKVFDKNTGLWVDTLPKHIHSLEEASSNSLTILVSTLEEELQAILSRKHDSHTSPDEPSPPTKNTHDLTPDYTSHDNHRMDRKPDHTTHKSKPTLGIYPLPPQIYIQRGDRCIPTS